MAYVGVVAFTESWWLSFSLGFIRWICSCASPMVVGVVVGLVMGTVVGVVFNVLASGPVVGGWGDMWRHSIALLVITVADSMAVDLFLT